MRTLRIERGGRIFIDNSLVDIVNIENKSDFISSLLLLDVELSNDMTVSDLIHFFYDGKEIISSFFSEDYEIVRALTTSSKLPFLCKELRVFKSFKIEKDEDGQEFMYMIPEVELINSDEGLNNIGSLPIFIDEEINLFHEDFETREKLAIKSKTKLNLFDLMICLFDELSYLIKDGFVKN